MRNSILILVVGASAYGAAPIASASEPPVPPGGPAINQYVETVPSGGGGHAVGVGQWHRVGLPKKAQKKLNREATPLAPKLRSIATSSDYGAPQQTLPRRDATRRAAPSRPPSAIPKTPPSRRMSPKPVHRSEEKTPEGERNAVSAAVSAATGSGSRAPLILLVVIVLLTTAAGILAAAKRARHGR
jgi:hypothetical protein